MTAGHIYKMFLRNRVMYYLSYLIKCIMYIKGKFSVSEQVYLRKNIQRNMFFFIVFFFAKFTFSAKMRQVEIFFHFFFQI